MIDSAKKIMNTLTDLTEYDYSLIGKNADKAIEMGLADAAWYTCPIPKSEMRQLLERKNGPALRDTIIWFGLLFGFGFWAYSWWGSLWAILPFALYGVIYGSTSDSRWHESSHGTPFKSDWMNNWLYEISSFMVMRESTVWRWSHTRHHSDTIIVGRDPEIAVPRPPNISRFILNFFGIPNLQSYIKTVSLHCLGKLTEEEKTFIPVSEQATVYFKARIYAGIYLSVFALAGYTQSILPLLLIGLPNIYGSWLMPIYGNTQHAGLAENVLDHRLNCRTVNMNLINRYLYWNMNYHVEHHMFPLVPYHALPRLHQLIKHDTPPAYSGLWEAYREIIPAILRQRKDPTYHVKRKLPTPSNKSESAAHAYAYSTTADPTEDGWIEVCPVSALEKGDVIRFDHNKRTYAVYRTEDNSYYGSDGICTHGNAHLADGMVIGRQIECPKHNGRFDLKDGSPQRSPVCIGLRTYPVEVSNDKIRLNLKANQQGKCETKEKNYSFSVVSNHNVATFIKELVLKPVDSKDRPNYKPGDYLQIEIPAYGTKSFSSIEVPEPYATVWRQQHLFEFVSQNELPTRRNYSLASNPATDETLRFNVRIATPPRGQDCLAGVGSTYVHSLKPGDIVKATSPAGTFHIKETTKEMLYIGGGAGMAPIRSHLSYLLETVKSKRTISYWYGARSSQEIFYQDYFNQLAKANPNFRFEVALSEPQPEDNWTSHLGYIHKVVQNAYLKQHADPKGIEYYLCGPPAMIQATSKMLQEEFGVPANEIAYDEF